MTEFDELKTDVAVLKSEVKNWMDTTIEYRKSLCHKIDIITDKLNSLGCAVHSEKMNNFGMQLIGLWSCAALVLGAMVTQWVQGK
jgi:hypothetical protein